MRKQLFLTIVIWVIAMMPLISVAQETSVVEMYASDVSFFDEGRKVGLKKANGEVICDAIFDYAMAFDDNGLSVIRIGNQFGFLRLDGTYVLYETDECDRIFLARKDVNGDTMPYTFKKGKYFGIMSRDGEIILDAIWEEFYGYSVPNGGKLSNKDRYYHVDYAGNVMPEGGADTINMLDDGRFEIIIDNQVFAYDKDSVLYAQYLINQDKTRYLTNIYIDSIEVKSDSLEDFFPLNNGLFAVKQGGKWGVFDRNRNMVIDFQWDDIYQAQRNPHVFGVGLGDKHGWITHEGEVVLPLQYKKGFWSHPIHWFDDNRWTARYADGGLDIVDEQGNVIATFGEEYEYDFSDEKYIRFSHAESQTWGFINSSNGEVTNTVSWDWAAGGGIKLENGYILVWNTDLRQYGYLGAEGGLFVTKDLESAWFQRTADAMNFVEVDGGFFLLIDDGVIFESIIWENILDSKTQK